MSVYKRKGSPFWQIQFSVKGEKFQRSSGTKSRDEAELIEAKLKQEVWNQLVHGKLPILTLAEASEKWVDEKAHEKRSIHRDIERLCFLCESMGQHPLETIDRDMVLQALKPKRSKSNGPISAGTINAYLSIIISVQNAAFIDWKLTKERSRIRKLPLDNKRNRWITPEQADALEAGLPERFKKPMRLCLLTGLRQKNVFDLRWEWINVANRTVTIPAKHYKGKREFSAPLNQDAIALIRSQIGYHSVFVFGEMGLLGGGFHAAWNKAKADAGITDFRWHDLRHTWASWHVQLGTSLQELMELGGWKSIDMVLRYAHLAPSQKHCAADRLLTKSLQSLIDSDHMISASPQTTRASEV
ncbi:site-specific integrase [Motiliproteus sp. MSK22-1]|uniref:tyrosine-type recombinase/integrase n=1 Tax=Motiliproteus sp. MSK22-1 TaxID=1897630 RepID=UPI00097A71D6|nr:site-specific integrase [Motiliproteus sp. MSK22-1]OMH30222.1 hypothetical protein BGP75_17660 [Motiliproteus sp. MSK22-1]